jgi:hypothetical protein
MVSIVRLVPSLGRLRAAPSSRCHFRRPSPRWRRSQPPKVVGGGGHRGSSPWPLGRVWSGHRPAASRAAPVVVIQISIWISLRWPPWSRSSLRIGPVPVEGRPCTVVSFPCWPCLWVAGRVWSGGLQVSAGRVGAARSA